MAKVTRITLENSGGPDRRRLHLREISVNGDTPLESVGQDLRHARQKRGEELEQIARVLKVRKDLLEAIEESNMEALPGRAYAIGFVRSYADYLGLDSNNAVERLKAEIAGRGDGKESPTSAAPPPSERWAMPSGTWIFGGLLILVLIYSLYYLVVSASRTSQPVIPVPERLAEQARIDGQPSAAAVVQVPPPPATDPAAAVTVRALPTPPAPAAPAAVTPPPAPAAPVAAPPPPLPPGQKYGAQNVGSRITLRVHRPALVNVRGGDDRLFMNRHLNPGDTYLVPNLVGLRLNTPDAGAVEVILDGSSVGFVGQDGADATNVSLNPNDVADRQRRG